ncbi:MAG: acyl-CoA thioester hydrolase [Hyphomicrobiaceae bacterium]|jgi:acyl-CoA thioester hydrolase
MSVQIQPIAVFRSARTVAAADVDSLDHVNNVVWVRYVFELAESHSRAVGLTMDAYRELGGFWIVRRHEIDYRAQAHEGQEIVGTTWVYSNRGPINMRRYEFVRPSDDQVLVRAVTTWAFVDSSTGRARRPPAQAVDGFPVVDDPEKFSAYDGEPVLGPISGDG